MVGVLELAFGAKKFARGGERHVDGVGVEHGVGMRFGEGDFSVNVVVGGGDRFAGASMAGEGFPEVCAVFDVRGFIDVGRAAGGFAVVHRGEEAAAVLVGEAGGGVGVVVDDSGESAGVALHHDGDDA